MRACACLCVPPYTVHGSFPRRRTTACARRVAEGWPKGGGADEGAQGGCGERGGWHVERRGVFGGGRLL